MSNKPNIKRIDCDFSNGKLYNPVYIPLFYDTTRNIHLFGSAGSGKSVFGCQKEIVLSFEEYRRGRKTLCGREVKDTLKDSLYSELIGVISEWQLWDYFDATKSPLRITNKLTDVEFIFKGLDDVQKLKSLKGVDRALIEEATDIKHRKTLDQLNLRLRGFPKDEMQLTWMYNPIDEHHWLNTEIHQQAPEDHLIVKTTYKDNIRMLETDLEYEKRIQHLKESNPNYYRVYVEGEWGQVVEGLIYQEYSTVNEFPQKDGRDDIHFYGLDFGFTNPTALIAQHIEDALPKQKLINKEILYEGGLDAPNLVRRFNELGIRKDVQIIADSARPEMIESLNNAGYKVKPCIKFAGSVLSGINEVRKYELCFVAGSKNLFKEVQNYQKKEVKGVWFEEPALRQVDHGLDALRYGLDELKTETSVIETFNYNPY